VADKQKPVSAIERYALYPQVAELRRPDERVRVRPCADAISWAVFPGVGELTKSGGWAFDLQGFFFFVAVAIALLGVGKLSVGGENGKLT
jgi:hypothetical protein